LDELVMQRGPDMQDDEAREQAAKLLGSGAPEPANTISGRPAARGGLPR
jgi:hypothetical protein